MTERGRDQPQVLVSSILATKVAKLPQRSWPKQVFAASSMASFEGHPERTGWQRVQVRMPCGVLGGMLAAETQAVRQAGRQAAAAVIITVAVVLRAARIN